MVNIVKKTWKLNILTFRNIDLKSMMSGLTANFGTDFLPKGRQTGFPFENVILAIPIIIGTGICI